MNVRTRLLRPLLTLLLITALLAGAAPASAYSYGPEFQSVSIYPASATPGTPVNIYVRARDAQAGVRDGFVTLQSPSGKRSVDVHLHWDYQESVLVGTFTPTQYHEGGQWRVSFIDVYNNDRGTTTIDAPQPSVGFTLSGITTPDLTPPIVGTPRLTTSAVAAGQPFALEVALSDDGSGVAGGIASYAFAGTSGDGMTPDDNQTTIKARLVPVGGGIWRAEFAAPVDPGPARCLSVVQLQVWDAAGNHVALDEHQLGLSVSVEKPSLPEVGGIADDRIDLFYGHPMPFPDWAERDLTRLGQLYQQAYRDPYSASAALVDEIVELDSALAVTEGDLFMPAQPSGLRLASPGVTGRMLALAGALRGRLALYSMITTVSTVTYSDVIRWADTTFPLDASMGPVLVPREGYQAYGPVLADLIARGLAESTIPPALYTGQHEMRSGWNDDLIPDNVVWLVPYSFSGDIAGYHNSDEGDIFIGFDQVALEQPLDTIDTAVHELGHHIHDVLLGSRWAAGFADYLRLRGIPQSADVGVGHDGLREEAFASDIVVAYAPAAVVNATEYSSPYPGPQDVPDLGGTVRGFVAAKIAEGLPDLFLLTNPGREVALTASSTFPLAGRARPGERVTIRLTDDLAGLLASDYYGDVTEVTASADGRFSIDLELWGEGLYAVQAEIDRGGSKYVETAFIVFARQNPMHVTWGVPADTPLTQLPVTGTAPAGARIDVNGVAGVADATGRFSVNVPLVRGPNTLKLMVTAAGAGGRTRELTADVNCSPSSAIAVDPLPVAVRTNPVPVSGTGPAGSSVVIAGGAAVVSARTGSDGRFSANVTLKPGRNRLSLSSWGPESFETEVTYDPAIALTDSIPATSSSPRLVVSGQADPGSTVSINGKPTPVNASGGFVAVVRPTAAGTDVAITATDPAGNTATATRTVILAGAPPRLPNLKDLAGHWSRSEVESLIALGIVNGLPGGVYQPNRSINRAEFVKMLAVATGLAPDARAYPAIAAGATGIGAERVPFIDTTGHWASGYIQAAVKAGFVVPTDYAEGRFDPDARISRREIAVMAVRALGLSGRAERSDGGAKFADAESIGPEWEGYAVVAQTEGIVTGLPGGIFGPDQPATRAQAATIINRVLTKLER